MTETQQQSLAEIFDEDSASLSRISKALALTIDTLISETVARDNSQRSAVHIKTLVDLREILYQAEGIIVHAQSGLKLPPSFRTQEEPF
jgi:hypothetical protein